MVGPSNHVERLYAHVPLEHHMLLRNHRVFIVTVTLTQSLNCF